MSGKFKPGDRVEAYIPGGDNWIVPEGWHPGTVGDEWGNQDLYEIIWDQNVHSDKRNKPNRGSCGENYMRPL